MKDHSTFIVLVIMAALAAVFALGNWYFYFVPGSDVNVERTDSAPVLPWLRIVASAGLFAVATGAFFGRKNLYARTFWGILIVEAIGGVAWEIFGAGLSSNVSRIVGGINSTCLLIFYLILLATHRSAKFALFEDS